MTVAELASPSRRRRPAFWLIALLAAAGGAAAARSALQVTWGLTAEYFANDQRRGQPAIRTVSAEVSTRRMIGDWDGSPPAAFSARWFGYLLVSRQGSYTFATTSDDGSSLSIDGRVVVDNGGVHGAETRTGSIRLERGQHFVVIEYAQAGGAYAMDWRWTPEGGQLSPVPHWALTPARVPYWKVAAARLLEAIRRSAAWLCVLGCLFVAFQYLADAQTGAHEAIGEVARTQERRHRWSPVVSLAFFVMLAIVHTWPLATDPARLSRNDNGDTMLNEWTMAWFAHQAPRTPLRLYDANIFYPERLTLAYSEAMIVQSAMGAPLQWLGASAVLAYNLVLLAGFALTGWTMSLVVTRWTGDWIAGLASGILAGFNAHTLTRLPHMQAQHVEFLPLALLALDALLREPRIGRALRLAAWFTLQALTSVYLLVFCAFGLAAAALARPESWWGRRFRSVAPQVALAAVVAALALLPFLLPYWRLYQDHGLSRSLADASQFSGSWQDYLSTPGRFHYAWWSHRFFTGNGLFPGVVAIALTLIAIVRGVALRDPRARMCLALGVCGVALSFGPSLPGYATLYGLVPLLPAIRAPVRFGYLAIVATAVVAGFGLVELRRRLPARYRTPVSGLLLVVVAIEPLAAPLSLRPFNGIPAIYRQLRAEPHAVVVELPFPRAPFVNARYMLNSTEHWKPMLNGYSGFLPASYLRNYKVLSGFPHPASIDALQALGVTHLFVHMNQFGPQIGKDLDQIPALRKVSTEGAIALYRLDAVRSAQ